MRKYSTFPKFALNAICPYYAMFPLEFPMRILRRAPSNSVILDAFCGRGTTNYAAHVLGMKAYGVDNSPVAVAIAQAKFSVSDQAEVLGLAEEILSSVSSSNIPTGVFWRHAFHAETLEQICSLREGLQEKRLSNKVALLRALCLGCLHGPLNKDPLQPSYFSNQMPRTFASKPNSAVRFWTRNRLTPRQVDIMKVLARKASRSLKVGHHSPNRPDNIRLGDSGTEGGLRHVSDDIDLVITSPPYFGLQTYIEDQWLRNWFLGGPDTVPYGQPGLDQRSPTDFAYALSRVWYQIACVASGYSRMVVRFGSIGSRNVDCKSIMRDSLQMGGGRWRVYRTLPIGTADKGRRQAALMGTKSRAVDEYDFFCQPV